MQDHNIPEEMIKYVEEALSRLKNPSKNANGGDFLAGGAYWRLTEVIKYLDEVLDDVEGDKHAAFLRKTHGVIREPSAE